jgi:hypothetical protein
LAYVLGCDAIGSCPDGVLENNDRGGRQRQSGTSDKAEEEPTVSLVISWPGRWGGGGGRGNDGGTKGKEGPDKWRKNYRRRPLLQ